ncbi:MAG: transposase [Chloroflexi bacterium]|nr:transposase [Chloroflexota bacterium]MDA8186975.1 transposase [Dehalococcoidales bacterium]
MHILQQPLLDFNEFFALDESDRLVLVLKTIDAEHLIRVLQGEDDVGRTGFHARVLWAALIAGVVYRIPSVAELHRNLLSNPYLRYVCGISSAANVPSESTFSRFLARLVQHEDLLDQCVDDLVRRFAVLAPDFGEAVVADSTDMHAYARYRKSGSADPDATWSAKSSKEASSKRGKKTKLSGEAAHDGKNGDKKKTKDKYWWFGYKLHLLVDAKYEVPIAATLTTAKVADTTQLKPLLEKRDALLPEVALKLGVCDGGYDSKSNIVSITERGAIPIIPLNPGNEKEPPGITNTLGTPLCPIGLPMMFWGRDGHYLKYRCPEKSGLFCCLEEHQGVSRCSTSDYGLVVKLNMADDPRRYVPVPRETKKWERLYKLRTAVERVNSRLKENLILDELRVRGKKKVKVRVGLNLLVMLAIAVAMAERNRLGDCRRIVTCAA